MPTPSPPSSPALSPTKITVDAAASASPTKITPSATRQSMLKYLYGTVAEWLRSGLQNRVHRFNSGRCLQAQSPHRPRAAPMLDILTNLCYTDINRKIRPQERVIFISPPTNPLPNSLKSAIIAPDTKGKQLLGKGFYWVYFRKRGTGAEDDTQTNQNHQTDQNHRCC